MSHHGVGLFLVVAEGDMFVVVIKWVGLLIICTTFDRSTVLLVVMFRDISIVLLADVTKTDKCTILFTLHIREKIN
jgi:hypothetical protein